MDVDPRVSDIWDVSGRHYCCRAKWFDAFVDGDIDTLANYLFSNYFSTFFAQSKGEGVPFKDFRKKYPYHLDIFAHMLSPIAKTCWTPLKFSHIILLKMCSKMRPPSTNLGCMHAGKMTTIHLCCRRIWTRLRSANWVHHIFNETVVLGAWRLLILVLIIFVANTFLMYGFAASGLGWIYGSSRIRTERGTVVDIWDRNTDQQGTN